MTGQVVSHYRVVDRIGEGGMGVVYRAEDLRLGRRVALKFLPPEMSRVPAALERFRREAETISSLNHPHVCTLYDIGEHDGRQFLVLELVEGRSLKDAIGDGPLTVPQAVRLASEVADALDAAHARGIVHRDVKPGNILTTARGDAKLLDFGIATLEAQANPVHAADAVTRGQVTAPGSWIGTPDYMSPEQVRGEPTDARSDLFALGAVMFEMLTGKPAFAASSPGTAIDAVLHRIPKSPSHLNPDVPQELSRIILKALEKDPEFRYQTAKELLADLRRLARDTTASHAAGAPSPIQAPPHRAGTIVVIAGAVLALALAAAGWWWMTSRDGAETGAAPGAMTPAGPADPDRLVVLPFENLTRRPDEDWLAGAFADSVSAGLQPVASLILVPRERVVELYAAEARRESAPLNADLARQVSQKLRVRYYVHGSYQRVGDEVRIVARLVDMTADAIQAQETLTGPFADVLRLEETLASRFATRLSPAPATSAGGAPAATSSLEAYQLVTDARALYALGRFSEASAMLQKATGLDPRYSVAWALRAKSNARLLSPAVVSGQPSTAALRAALEDATTAVTLDPTAVESHLALALAYRGLKDRLRWRESANRGAALDPRNGEARILLGDALSISPGFGCPTDSEPAAAEEAFRQGLRIDPLAASGYVNLTTHRWWMGRRVDALAALDEGLAAHPGNVLLNSSRPFNLLFAGRVDEAAALLKRRVDSGVSLTPLEVVTLGYVALRRQRLDEAAARFSRGEAARALANLAFTMITAVAHFEAGRPAEGAAYLARGIAAEPECADWARQVPALTPYRDTPEFARAVNRNSSPPH